MRRWAVALVAAVIATACAAGAVTQDDGQRATDGSRLERPPTSRPSGGRDLPPVAPLPGDEANTTDGGQRATDSREPEVWIVGAVPLEGEGPWETPAELVDRQLTAPDLLPPPAGDTFAATVQPVPDDVVARSTWRPGCPVDLEDLRYATLSFWGFDGSPHTGEMIVHASVADAVVSVFRALFEARFPIEEMRVIRGEELEALPTGDGNVTTSFVCRPVVGTESTWSQHAYGLAVDVNPFHNPYVKGDVVLPELAGAYTDRERGRPGMVVAGDAVTAAFEGIGWSWGGTWRSLTDPMHFSANGR